MKFPGNSLGTRNKNRYAPGQAPPNKRRAELLRYGCIYNYPSTLESRSEGLIGEHRARPLSGTRQPFAPDSRCVVCRRPTNRHATICPEPAALARQRRAAEARR